MNSVKSVEEFRDIPGFPNHIISNYGKVFAKEKVVLRKDRFGRPFTVKTAKRRVFGQQIEKVRYVTLSVNGKPKKSAVKKLLLETFKPLDKKGFYEIETIDGDERNLCVDNFRWDEVTVKQRELEKNRIPVSSIMQKTWDTCLIKGWKHDWSLWKTVRNFCMMENLSVVMDDGKFDIWFYSLNLKRSGERYEMFDKTTRCFIADHSMKLSSCLFSHSEEACLEVIDNFKWNDCTHLKSKRRVSKVADKTIQFRNFSEHQWGHVK